MTIRGLFSTAVVCISLTLLPSPICSLNLFPLEIKGKYGYIDETGQIRIKPTFKIANQFRDGRALVKLNDHMFFINEAGNMVFEIEERSGTEFSEGLLAFSKSGKWGFVDCNGKIVIKPFWVRAESFSEGFATVKNESGKYTYIKKDGSLAFGQTYFDICYPFSGGKAIVGKQLYPDTYESIPGRKAKRRISGVRKGVINAEGELIIPFKFTVLDTQFSDGLAIAGSLDKKLLSGYINGQGNFMIEPKFKLVGRFSEGLAPASTGNLYGIIDTLGKYIIPERYEDLRSFSEGLAVFALNGKYGYINRFGEVVVENRFDVALSFENGLGFVRLGKDSGYVNRKGHIFWASAYK